MHGDQPAAKPMPTANDASSERFALRTWRRLSIIRNGILKTPIMFRPRTMTTSAADPRDPVLVVDEHRPIALAERPMRHEDNRESARRTRARGTSTRARLAVSDCALSSSRLEPVRNER